MAEFFDLEQFGQFDNDEELFTYIIEEFIKPRLAEALGEDADIDDIQGKVLVFGGREGVDPDDIQNIQEHIQNGLDLDYILNEMTDLTIRTSRETTIGGLTVHYVELIPRDDDVDNLSVDELQAMFLASPDGDDEQGLSDGDNQDDDDSQRSDRDDEFLI